MSESQLLVSRPDSEKIGIDLLHSSKEVNGS